MLPSTKKILKPLLILSNLVLLRYHFKQIFFDKEISVVGNAPTTMGRGYGADIDRSQIVVRFNLLNPFGREEDLGGRTDVRFVGCTLRESHSIYFLNAEPMTTYISTRKNKEFLNKIEREAYFYHQDLPRYSFILLRLFFPDINIINQNRPPRTGLVFLILLLSLCQPKKVSVYGFSKSDDDVMKRIRYRSHGVASYDSANYSNYHCDPLYELEILARLEECGLITIYK